jgi:hypothetical protein
MNIKQSMADSSATLPLESRLSHAYKSHTNDYFHGRLQICEHTPVRGASPFSLAPNKKYKNKLTANL